ncbi:MAG: substrate-binding domain-containing protein [Bacillota bacterium]|nr:substrate-binding domain-containing protein [Bacillota bacterium]
MIKVKKAVGLLLAVTTLVGSAFVPSFQAHAATILKVGGSTTIAPLARNLETAFEGSTGNQVDVQITEGGSGAGLTGVIDGTLDVGMMSRDLTASEKSTYPYLIPITVGKDAIAIVVNPANAVGTNLTSSQVKDLFSSASTSSITNWNQLGGANAPIVVHTRTDGSGTLDAFKELALDKASVKASAIAHASSEELQAAVAADVNAIGFVSLGYVDSTVRAESIDNKQCTVYNAKNGIYPYVRPLNYVTKREPVGNALKWIYYNLGKDAQDQMDVKKYIRVNDSQLDIAVEGGIQSTAAQVASELDDGISLAMNITTYGSAEAALADVRDEKKEAAIIKGPLTADWSSQGLAGKEVAQDASGNKYTFVTKAFGTVEALGAAEVFRYAMRNPRGQKIAIKYNLNRVWKFGDVTGDGLVNSADYASLRSYLLKKVVSLPASAWLFSADVTGDNRIDSADASVLQAYLLKKPAQYPTIQAEKAYVNYYPPMP